MTNQKHGLTESIQRWWHQLCRSLLRKLFLGQGIFKMQTEVPVTNMPLRADFILERVLLSDGYDNPLAKYFRKHNIIEFKSPADYLGFEDFCRGLSYAHLYHLYYHNGDYTELNEITLTFVCTRFPRKLFQNLALLGFTVHKNTPIQGVYRISGALFFIQIIVMNYIENTNLLYLMSPFLTGKSRAGGKHVLRLIQEWTNHPDDQDLFELVKYALEYGVLSKHQWKEVEQMLSEKRLKEKLRKHYEEMQDTDLGRFLVAKGITKGKLEGKLEERREIMKHALLLGVDASIVARMTSMPETEVVKIQKELQVC